MKDMIHDMIYRFALLAAVVASLSGCRGWLAVDSKDRIMEEELFKDTDGFYTALN